MRVDKREFAWEFSQLTLVSRSNENKSYMRVDESWEARVCMRVFLTLVLRSNENKSFMKVDESWEARVCMRIFSTVVPRSNENKSCLRVGESLHERFLNSHSRLGQTREQELHESWWELTSESWHESFLNSRTPVKRETRVAWVDESWEARFNSHAWQTRTRVIDESLHDIGGVARTVTRPPEIWKQLKLNVRRSYSWRSNAIKRREQHQLLMMHSLNSYWEHQNREKWSETRIDCVACCRGTFFQLQQLTWKE
jgi:hypothetical protein